jgi:NADPH:quinone reductase-like Zn-dependent oxidoreductase
MNGGHFDIVIDMVGGKMLSACCELLVIDGNLASVTEVPVWMILNYYSKRMASFHPIGANAYSLSDNQEYWKINQHILNHLSELFDSHAIS